jgi:hypothetical protein
MTPESPRFPDVEVELSGTDGNAFAIIGTVLRALRRSGALSADLAEFQSEATSGDYDHVLQTAMRWVVVS